MRFMDKPKIKDKPKSLAITTTISFKIQLIVLSILQYKTNYYLKYVFLFKYKEVIQYL